MIKCIDCGLLKNKKDFRITKGYNKKLYQRHECKECEQKRKTKYRKDNIEKTSLYNYIKIDKKKNLICDLTINWLKENITNKSCIYCGETEKLGCDRIDNNKGHSMDNVVPCCGECNRLRSNKYSVSEMLKIGSVIRQIKNDKL